jgi:hypothetical protein
MVAAPIEPILRSVAAHIEPVLDAVPAPVGNLSGLRPRLRRAREQRQADPCCTAFHRRPP